MPDWLDEIEEEKKRKERELHEYLERGRPEREAALARAEASYQRNKETIDRTFSTLTEYAERVNKLTDAYLVWKITDKKYELFKRPDKYTTLNLKGITVYVSEDNFTLHADYPIPYPGKGRYHGRGSDWLEIPISRVSKEHISEWVKWLAQGNGPPRWKDTRPWESGIKLPDYTSRGCLYSPWTYIIILGIILFFIYLSSQK